ncbi:MAG: glutathione S-transferase [Pseudomonadota bacterium]
MTAPILYSFRRCPYAMRARMALAVSGRPVRLREILLRDKPDEMLAASAKGTVPVLQLEDGTVIDESLDVMRWALDHFDPEYWLPNDAATLEKMSALIAENDGPFKHHLDRYKYSTRYEGAEKEAHRAEGERFLRKLEARLQGSRFLFGEARSLADIAIFPFVRQFRIADPAWFDAQDWSRLREWLSALIDAPLFQDAMKKYDLWKETHKEFAFP